KIAYTSCYFFFSSRRRHTRSKRDWSSDVCSSEMFARLKQQQMAGHDFEGSSGDLDEDLKPEERSQRDLALAVMHRHAAQMAAAAAAAAGLHGNAAHLANLAASVGGLGGLNLNQNAICQLNSALMGSNSSPSGASGSSGSGVASSPALQSIEPGKGYTYEEQFKQVCHRVVSHLCV